ncbi:hypothetical protein IFM89_008556 [Coptis chinensis]|uniref:Uncharacterized protein n=1 Tax=Coptis chinensis TaxID=261450 RepID=A0A835I0L8_9MAGN|nr:hypothetical protein IFM89_008556 [Coptis chinensis]
MSIYITSSTIFAPEAGIASDSVTRMGTPYKTDTPENTVKCSPQEICVGIQFSGVTEKSDRILFCVCEEERCFIAGSAESGSQEQS